MGRYFQILMICGVAFTSLSCKAQYSYTHPIAFAPEQYVCYRASESLKIDGQDQEDSWQNAPWTTDFVDIEGTLKPQPHLRTRAKMLWDDTYFYFYAHLEEPHVWATLKNRDDIIYYDDDFEIFIDPDGDSHNYYELELNALNTLWDLILLRPYRVDDRHKVLFEWNISGIKTAVHVEGTLNDPNDEDQFWSIEFAIPWNTLKEFARESRKPKNGEQWRVNFSRVDWTMEIIDNKYQKRINRKTGKPVPENNWVWSPTGRINMHMPEMWGFVQFSDQVVGQTEVSFIPRKDEKIKWALWNVYWQELAYFEKHKEFSADLQVFTIPEVQGCDFVPEIFITPQYFEITARACDSDDLWIIDRDGRISTKPN